MRDDHARTDENVADENVADENVADENVADENIVARDVRVRLYDAADLDACLRIFDSNVPASFTPLERAAFETFLRDLPGPYFVLEDRDGALIGCGGYAVTPHSRTADLCWGMIARHRQGTGLGRRLTEERLARIVNDPLIEEVALRTSQHTRAFYERRGFITERIVADGIAPGLDECHMRLRIAR